MAPRRLSKRNASKPVPVPVPLSDELVTLEVTGPMCLLRDPVLRKVKKNLKIREVVGKFLSASKLVGYRATTIKGTSWNSVGLETTVGEYITKSYKRPSPVIKMRLLKPRVGVAAEPTPEIVTIDEEDEDSEVPAAVGVMVGSVTLNLEDMKEEAGEMEGGGDDQANALQPPPMEPEPQMVESVSSPPPPPAPVTLDDQQPGSSRAMREAMARERVRRGRPVPPPPPPSSSENRGVRVKKEATVSVNIKREFEMHNAASTIANLKSKGVRIENMKELTQTRIRQFNNPFLLLARQEMRDLQRNVPGCPEWQKVVAKAPKCAYLLHELFRPLKDGQN